MAKLLKALAFVQQLQRETVRAGDLVVDATAGQGFDTEFLARLVGEQGHVYAFDVQELALRRTKERLAAAGLLERVTLCHAGHEDMPTHVVRPVRSVMFNLGYLPGSDHRIITRPDTTVRAVQAAAELVQAGGLITLVIYPGHAGGVQEQAALTTYLSGLPQGQYTVARYEFINQINNPPLVIAIEKNAAERVFV